MSRLLDDDQDDLPQRQRELTLSTGAILAIFLGLLLLCGVFFGFGYNLGRKSTTTPNAALPAPASDAEPAATEGSNFDNFKPSPSAPATSSSPAPSSSSATARVVKTEAEPAPAPVHTAPAPATTVPHTPPPTTAPAHAAQPAAPATAPGGSFVVQIAAISPSHKDDADLLANALHSKGYDVAEHAGQDKLIHIQVGPFATKADAEAMRERLIVDGYNAIVK
jgi:cell division septation protein DedD